MQVCLIRSNVFRLHRSRLLQMSTASSSVVSAPSAQVQIIRSYGGPEVFEPATVAVAAPSATEALVAIKYSGVNFIDTYMRMCLADAYKRPLPAVLGREGAGVIVSLGDGSAVEDSEFKIGDRVCFASAYTGSYATLASIPTSSLIKVPENVGLDVAAALMLQGMTAHYLACSVPTSKGVGIQKGQSCLVHAGAGGVGRLLIQIAKLRGAETVIATVSSEEKAKEARACGADHVVMYTVEDVAAAVKKITGGKGVDVVYDGVGKTTFTGSLDSLRPRGMLALYGNASGTPPAVEPLELMKRGSLMVTRTNLLHFTETREELLWRASDCLNWASQGMLNVRIDSVFGLSQVADAHRALESRGTMGKIILDTSK
ncbi:mitochondrial zeta crystallin-like protein [Andalucia godoyi]|uniref:Mitochondrial zeta crystallin-like protein n=1 Tax=Andalucia godoyi TaxID=505711 RepID=A0A8K0AIB1_ANDGO|nr:mitochondrial zeta crystallin-like protein [Andalucia godoyi]|eukprot:ANDGO_04161.mRNA.1 mitochondrial zeta crystallin homolog (NADPH2 quinone oxidoreductase)